MNLREAVARTWLRGFMDGEGCVFFRARTPIRPRCDHVISVVNTDPRLMRRASRCLTYLGIAHKIREHWKGHHTQGNRLAWVIYIRDLDNFMRFGRFVGFTSTEKRAKLKASIACIFDHKFKPRKTDPRRRTAMGLYADKCSIGEISKLTGLAPATIRKMLSDAGIAQRPRGEAVRLGQAKSPFFRHACGESSRPLAELRL